MVKNIANTYLFEYSSHIWNRKNRPLIGCQSRFELAAFLTAFSFPAFRDSRIYEVSRTKIRNSVAVDIKLGVGQNRAKKLQLETRVLWKLQNKEEFGRLFLNRMDRIKPQLQTPGRPHKIWTPPNCQFKIMAQCRVWDQRNKSKITPENREKIRRTFPHLNIRWTIMSKSPS
jgi:hypothetical protein